MAGRNPEFSGRLKKFCVILSAVYKELNNPNRTERGGDEKKPYTGNRFRNSRGVQCGRLRSIPTKHARSGVDRNQRDHPLGHRHWFGP